MATTGPDEIDVLGVVVTDVTRAQAIVRLERTLRDDGGRTHTVFFVNAHTLNLATDDPSYRQTLSSADLVFGDGTGVRWAARMQGVRIRDNVNGTDLLPELLRATSGHGYRLYLLGATADTIERAAHWVREQFPGWELVGWHTGHLRSEDEPGVVAAINGARPHLLLVGMGNPLQERWLQTHQAALRVPLCIAVGGLFDHWGGNLERAPRWVRRLGFEWVQLLLQQPHKFRRYVLGNPVFLLRAGRHALRGRGSR